MAYIYNDANTSVLIGYFWTTDIHVSTMAPFCPLEKTLQKCIDSDEYYIFDKAIIDWSSISTNLKLTEKFMEKFHDKIKWNFISNNQKLTENFIEKFHHKVDWYRISRYQNISEYFMKKFMNIREIDWEYICVYGNISKDLFIELKDKVNWEYIFGRSDISKSFMLRFHHKILWDAWAFHLTKNKCQMKNFFKIQQQTEAAFTCHFQCPYCKQEIEDYYDDISNVKCNFIKYFHYKLKYIQIKPDPTTPGSRHSLVFFPQGLGR